MTRVLIADHHTLVRAGIRSLLESVPGVRVVGEAFDGREAISQARRMQPDVVFTELLLPHLNGLDVTTRIRKDSPDTKVLMLTSLGGEEYVSRAIQAGASGYLVKDAAVTELAQAIDAVRRGEIYLSPGIPRGVLKRPPRGTRPRRKGAWQITERQREILKLLVEGKSTKQIAAQFNLSIKTVETHRTRLMDRLGIHDVPGLVRYALRTGLTKL